MAHAAAKQSRIPRRKPRQWHPAFYATIQVELQEDAEHLTFENEHFISKKPMQIDVLIVKKEEEHYIIKNIGRIFRKHNIFEYKGPSDYISIDDFYKVYGYACFYKSDGRKVNGRKITEITISFVSKGYPRKLMKHLKKLRKYEIKKKFKGIYYITGDILPIQFIIQNQLSKEENLWLKSLTDNLENDGSVQLLLEDYDMHRYNVMYDAMMDMIVRANPEKFKEEKGMCEALKELLMEMFPEEINARKEAMILEVEQKAKLEGERKGRLEGERKGRLEGERKGRLEGERVGRLEGERVGRLEGERKGRLEGMIATYKDVGFALEDTISKVAEKLGKEAEELRDDIIKYWNQ